LPQGIVSVDFMIITGMIKSRERILLKALQSFACCLSIAFIATVFSATPLRAEIDPQYNPQLEQLTIKLKARGFTDDELNNIFTDDRIVLYPPVVEKSGRGFDYFHKKFGLLTKKSIQRGQSILKENKEAFNKIEETFGVEKRIILGILRVETNFGAHTGNYFVFNSLLSMALIVNRRSSWAEEELIEFLCICKGQNKDPLSVKGSWAGAFGISQFVPTSYTKFAVDGNNDGVINLFDFHDAAASIANYLRRHGYERNRPVSNREAVYAYNHCDNYVKAIFAYAKALK
jgi:membrane-bound lytic murein transglycosylase B